MVNCILISTMCSSITGVTLVIPSLNVGSMSLDWLHWDCVDHVLHITPQEVQWVRKVAEVLIMFGFSESQIVTSCLLTWLLMWKVDFAHVLITSVGAMKGLHWELSGCKTNYSLHACKGSHLWRISCMVLFGILDSCEALWMDLHRFCWTISRTWKTVSYQTDAHLCFTLCTLPMVRNVLYWHFMGDLVDVFLS
jgi:hypothetical protein